MLCFKLSSVYFQHVNERAAHVKIDHDPRQCRPGPSNSLISPVVEWFSTTGVL